jgi:hypothetical protein
MVRLGFHKFFARWFLKMLMCMHRMLRMALALTLTFLVQYHIDGDVIRVAGDIMLV